MARHTVLCEFTRHETDARDNMRVPRCFRGYHRGLDAQSSYATLGHLDTTRVQGS